MRTPGNARIKFLLFWGDILVLFTAMHLAVFLRNGEWLPVYSEYTGALCFTTAVFLVIFYIADLYTLTYSITPAFIGRVIVSSFLATVSTAAVFYLLPHWRFGRGIFGFHLVVTTGLLVLWRAAAERIFPVINGKKKIILIGAGEIAMVMAEVLSSSEEFTVLGFVDDDPGKKNTVIAGLDVLGTVAQIPEIVTKTGATDAVIAISKAKNPGFFQILLAAKSLGLHIHDMPNLYGRLSGRLPVKQLRYSWFVTQPFHGMDRNVYMRHAKRVLDIALALTGIFCFTPLILLVAALIPLDSSGGILYRQRRVGQGGREYTILKFRTMMADAETQQALWAATADPRVTRLGRQLRLLRIDEIPQMLNVLKGEMSFVGPRPERPEFVRELALKIPYYELRHTVPPGITGWAQVNYPYGASEEDARMKLEYDLYYIKNLSVFFDIQILLKTVRVMLFGSGAR